MSSGRLALLVGPAEELSRRYVQCFAQPFDQPQGVAPRLPVLEIVDGGLANPHHLGDLDLGHATFVAELFDSKVEAVGQNSVRASVNLFMMGSSCARVKRVETRSCPKIGRSARGARL